MTGEPQRFDAPGASIPAGGGAPVDSEAVRLIAEAAPVLIWSASLTGANEWLSPSWVAYTGRAVEELQGEGWTSSLHPEDVDRCLGIRATSFAARSPFAMDLRLRRGDGEYRWMLDQGVPRLDTGGAAVGFVGSCVDIHERKALEEALAERTRQLRLAERRQGQFLATLSHELRNPLAPIANVGSVMRTLEATNPILVRLREILERQVARLGHLIEDLIDVTRAAQGQISLVRELLSVDSVVQAAVAASHDRLTTGGHRLDVELPDERIFVRADRSRLAQALAHLIGNAARFTFEPGTISIVVRRAAKTVQIAVRDQGTGIKADFLPHAFELFAQQDQDRARTTGGLGVGLTLARRIAQLHGGDVDGYSDGPGCGSEFILWLPIAEPDAAADDAESALPRLAEPCRVLIIEDDADALESLRLQMELWGTEVSVARNADEALVIAAQVRPQIVLCDIGLPGTDGLGLIEPLREKMGGAPVVFAAVTGYASAEDQQRALAAGFDSFFVKPLNAASLANLLRSHAGQRH
ncbi:MAG: ATP-binding protein [Caldimonas sp.]